MNRLWVIGDSKRYFFPENPFLFSYEMVTLFLEQFKLHFLQLIRLVHNESSLI